MQCPAQAALDGPERYQAEGPQRAPVGLSWAHGKGSRAQALFGHEPSRAWARLVQSLLATPSRGKKSQQRNTIRSGRATPIYLARIHAYLGIGSDKSALLRMARRRTRSEKEVEEHSLIGEKLFQISSEKFSERSVD